MRSSFTGSVVYSRPCQEADDPMVCDWRPTAERGCRAILYVHSHANDSFLCGNSADRVNPSRHVEGVAWHVSSRDLIVSRGQFLLVQWRRQIEFQRNDMLAEITKL